MDISIAAIVWPIAIAAIPLLVLLSLYFFVNRSLKFSFIKLLIPCGLISFAWIGKMIYEERFGSDEGYLLTLLFAPWTFTWTFGLLGIIAWASINIYAIKRSRKLSAIKLSLNAILIIASMAFLIVLIVNVDPDMISTQSLK